MEPVELKAIDSECRLRVSEFSLRGEEAHLTARIYIPGVSGAGSSRRQIRASIVPLGSRKSFAFRFAWGTFDAFGSDRLSLFKLPDVTWEP